MGALNVIKIFNAPLDSVDVLGNIFDEINLVYEIVAYMAYDSDMHTLHKACLDGNLEIIKYLVNMGEDIHAWDDCALMLVTKIGHLNVLQYLVEVHEIDIHMKNELIFELAAYSGHLDVVKYLVSMGAYIHIHNERALRYTAKRGHLDILKYLVDLGADVHANNNGALLNAAEHGHLDILKYLVETCQADVHAGNESALKGAVYYGHSDVAHYLIEHGAVMYTDDAIL